MRSTIYRQESRHLSRLAWPVITSQVGTMLMGLVDTLVVGRYSSVELAGVAAGNSIFWTIVMIGLGLLNGMDPIVSQAHGAADEKKGLQCLGISLRFGIIFSLITTLPMLWLAENLAMTGATAEVAIAARPYLLTLSLGLLPLMLASALQRYWQCMEVVLPFTVVIIVANLINLILDVGFVTGRWGLPALGAQGVAVATTGCRLFILAAAVWITHKEWRKRQVGPQNWRFLRSLLWQGESSMQREFLRLGVPAAGQMSLEVSAFSLSTLLMARLGASTLATHHIVLNIASFAFMFPLGIAAATATRVGYHIGRGDPQRAFPTGWLGIYGGAGVMLISSLILYFFPEWLLKQFTQDAQVIELGVSIIFLCVLFQIFDGVQVASAGALRGLGDTKTALYSNLVAHWGVGLPLGFSLCFAADYGLWGLWVGLALGLLLTASINTIFWQRRQTQAYRLLHPTVSSS